MAELLAALIGGMVGALAYPIAQWLRAPVIKLIPGYSDEAFFYEIAGGGRNVSIRAIASGRFGLCGPHAKECRAYVTSIERSDGKSYKAEAFLVRWSRAKTAEGVRLAEVTIPRGSARVIGVLTARHSEAPFVRLNEEYVPRDALKIIEPGFNYTITVRVTSSSGYADTSVKFGIDETGELVRQISSASSQ
ncbi:hypothetical protein [Pseudotabrizicola algicola]|uniref:Uncharacterized protein n=1 Tax=Pseudotabrizicola algicola TaxID=2709381 RepID=A0A6B3RGJ3_9RHOB|nr:hypothetical protein [Pseudotabrizicola algicola]NEX45174.1 hypothetical protein [Pseudotabrizicola algicola]